MIGVDIGGTNLLFGIVDNGEVVQRKHEPINNRNFKSVVNQVCNNIQSLTANPETIGIAVAGSVDANAGIVLRAQNLDWDNAPLANEISQKLQCSVVIENDVTASAWGEFNFGAGKEYSNMLAIWIGTGIGGGLVLNNKIWRGPMGTGGEFGMSISETIASHKNRELEAYASRSGFQKILNDDSISTEDIKQAFQESTGELANLINNGAKRIGTSIANAITLLSLDQVVLGGGIVEVLGDSYIELIRKQFEQDVFPKQLKHCTLAKTKLGPNAGLLGAAAIAKEHA